MALNEPGPEALALLDGLGAGDVEEELRGGLLERAEGNPFFLEELLAGLHDHALPAGTDVPDSVQAVLAAPSTCCRRSRRRRSRRRP